ncbi:GTPase [Schwartzia sp. (in: firmicutes)]
MSLEKEFKMILQELSSEENAYAKIAFVGQPGAGKSSIINALLGHKAAATGQGTDITREAAEYSYSFHRLVDLPGYGTDMFRFQDWKEQFRPEQYDVFVFVFSGKLTGDDARMLEDLKGYAENLDRPRPVFLVRNHGEELEDEDLDRVREDVYAHLNMTEKDAPLYFVDCRYKTGLTALSEAFRVMDYRSLWHDRVESHFYKKCYDKLEICRKRARQAIDGHKVAAGLNGANPIPGLDIGVDMAVYMDMFSDIRKAYHIGDKDLSRYSVMPIVRQILNLATKNGLMLLLKNSAGKVFMQKISKYVPLIGTAVAAGIGYRLCEYAGAEYVNDCEEAAEKIMDALMREQVKEWEKDTRLLLM